ncbi:MAG: prohibitin family protein [Deltaproteobacteria bacterium]|nr:prohibitin family protein [Deltaproteobacteria bacterium]
MKTNINLHILAVVCTAWFFANFSTGCATRSTEANEVGIRVNKLTGIDEKVYAPGGTYFFLPFVNDWYTYSTRTQRLEMTSKVNEGDRDTLDDIEFKTLDGNDVGVDVTVLYRIDTTQAVNILSNVAVNDYELKEKIVRPMARTIVRDALNTLTSEEIYTEKKYKAGQAAVTALNEAFKPYGLICENVTLGDHRFHPNYQKAIVSKKVYDQQVNTNRSAKEAAQNKWEAELEKIKGDVEQQIAQEQGVAKQVSLSADAYYFSKQKEAEAILAQKTNEAKGIIELNRAMASSGGRTNVKLRIAKALAGKKIVILPGGTNTMGVQKIDLNDLIRTALSQEAIANKNRASE